MKHTLNLFLIGALIAVALIAVQAVPVARADGPTDFQYAVAGYSGVDINTVVTAEQQYDTQAGFNLGLVTQDEWAKTYVSRANAFALTFGVPQMLYDDGVTNSGALTFAGKIWSAIGKAEYASQVTAAKK